MEKCKIIWTFDDNGEELIVGECDLIPPDKDYPDYAFINHRSLIQERFVHVYDNKTGNHSVSDDSDPKWAGRKVRWPELLILPDGSRICANF